MISLFACRFKEKLMFVFGKRFFFSYNVPRFVCVCWRVCLQSMIRMFPLYDAYVSAVWRIFSAVWRICLHSMTRMSPMYDAYVSTVWHVCLHYMPRISSLCCHFAHTARYLFRFQESTRVLLKLLSSCWIWLQAAICCVTFCVYSPSDVRWGVGVSYHWWRPQEWSIILDIIYILLD